MRRFIKADFGKNYLVERSNVIQYDMMGYPLRLVINFKGEQVWIDTEAEDGDVVLVWKNYLMKQYID